MDTINQMPYPSSSPEPKSVGPIVAVVIIIILLILGGLYFFKDQLLPQPNTTNQETETPANNDQTDPALLEIESSLQMLEKQDQNTETNAVDREFTTGTSN